MSGTVPMPRVEKMGDTTFIAEYPTDVRDGPYRLTVGWSDEDNAWLAFVGPLHCAPDWIGHGATQLEAVSCLAFALANLVDHLAPRPTPEDQGT